MLRIVMIRRGVVVRGGEGGDGEDEYEDTYKENNDTDGEDGVMTIEVRMVMMDGNNYDENEDEDCKG